jgi:putative PIN family toxin of toxin-antitoxin system
MIRMSKPVVIFDTGSVLQSVLNPAGPAAKAIGLMDKDQISVYVSPSLRSEYEDVLYRSSIRAKNIFITDEQVNAFLARFDSQTAMVANPPSYVNYARDPDDEPVINLAIHVGADYVVTRDNDLLDLMDEGEPDGRFFRRKFPQITFLNPTAFLEAMRLHSMKPNDL